MSPGCRVEDANPSACDARPVGPITRRLVCAMALVPIVPAVACIAADRLDSYFGSRGFDGLSWMHLLISALSVGGAVYIWRSVILWTLGRKWLTALVSLIPFVQVVYAQPVWAAGCVGDDILRIGQHQIGLGMWVWIVIWVWWGWEKGQMRGTSSTENERGARMTPTAKRLAASIGAIPFLFGCFWIIVQAFEDFSGLSEPVAEAFACAALLGIVVWILIWRRCVVWSLFAIRQTVVSALLFLALPIAAQKLFYESRWELLDAVLVFLPVIGWGLWMAVTMSIWPRRRYGTRPEDTPPRCLKCGYLLIGLRATRCPECGDEPTLDELWYTTTGEGL